MVKSWETRRGRPSTLLLYERTTPEHHIRFVADVSLHASADATPFDIRLGNPPRNRRKNPHFLSGGAARYLDDAAQPLIFESGCKEESFYPARFGARWAEGGGRRAAGGARLLREINTRTYDK